MSPKVGMNPRRVTWWPDCARKWVAARLARLVCGKRRGGSKKEFDWAMKVLERMCTETR